MQESSELFLLCPIPDEDKPINQYISLKQNPAIRWINNLLFLLTKNWKSQIVFIFLLIITLSKFFEISDFVKFKAYFILIPFFLGIISIFFLSLQINENFQFSSLIYEEGSWYDGKIWKKPLSFIKVDRVFNLTKIKALTIKNCFKIHTFLIFFKV